MVYTKNERYVTERNAMCRSATNCSERWRSTTRVSTDPPIDERANQYGAGGPGDAELSLKELTTKIGNVIETQKKTIESYQTSVTTIDQSIDKVSENLDKLIETYAQNRKMYSNLIERLTREKADSDKKVERLTDKNAKLTLYRTNMLNALNRIYRQGASNGPVKDAEAMLKNVEKVEEEQKIVEDEVERAD